MKRFNYYLSLMLLLVFTAACSDEFDQPPMVVPQASRTANITIAEFKAKHWQDVKNYIDTIKEDEVIHGWVTSSDEEGNIYKQIYISDGTGGLTISVDQSSMYTKFRLGQEVVIPMKGYYIGKFNGLLCLGVPYLWEEQNVWESNRMSMEQWEAMAELNGFPDVSKVDTTVIELSEIKGSDSETLLKYMSRLVRINGVTFADAGSPFSEPDASTDRAIVDESNNSIMVYNSSYATFRADTLPKGTVDVVGELCYTSSKGFHLLLRSASDVILNTAGGTKSNPFTVADAIAGVTSGMRGWVGGYAVGAVAPEVTSVTSNSDIEWKAPTTLDNTIVLADDPDCKDYTKCIIVPLAQGSQFRVDANLKSNPNVYKSFVKAKGAITSYMGIVGLTDNIGSTDTYVLDVALTKFEEGFDGGIPSGWTNLAVSGGKTWSTYSYTSAGQPITCAQFRATGSSSQPIDSWLITPKLDIKNAKSKVFNFTSEVNNVGNNTIELYLLDSNDPRTATVKVKLNPTLPAKPTGSSTYSAWVSSGDIDLSQWSDGEYFIGFNFNAPAGGNYTTWCIDNVTFGMGEVPVEFPENFADFHTMGTPTSTIGNFTSENGWEAKNCTLLIGKSGSNPNFAFIGNILDTNEPAVAPTMNGGTNMVGTIVSPKLKGGLSKLSFNYGAAFSGNVISFRVDVKKNGNVVKSWTITENPMTQKHAYSFEGTCSVSGEFTIEFTNLSPSNATGDKKDRFSVWNVTWEN